MDIHTARLRLEPLDLKHDELIVAVFNDPDFLNFVGDKGIRTLAQAQQYLRDGPMAERQQSGIVNYAVIAAHSGEAIGMCGLLQRPYLPEPDLGYGFLPSARGQGYAYEAASAVLASLKAPGTLWAMVNPANAASLALLHKLGFVPYGDDNIALPHSPTVLLTRQS
ncbi:GNAT family N-acetyltransferase [Simiduia curdlanivorans]|uniref:GNAT family N-acetyltransferase n=1 Tax=Simiduia curdlanivorans TaxID=1492769 RepID=A0ABV8UYU3_9GAMM|nr:GNAT family N-acetyltransferase [Simiduia curdlanivorans]MDN3640462.1 GNAT family N-acetyltransferase [Simiduia curdlanivorans]